MDPISEMFSKIKNAQSSNHKSLYVPYSKIKMAILAILKNKKFIENFEIKEQKNTPKNSSFKRIDITLINEKVTNLVRVSRPSKRVYASSYNIPRLKRPKSLVIISTSEGVLEGEEARRKGLGGEIIGEVR